MKNGLGKLTHFEFLRHRTQESH